MNIKKLKPSDRYKWGKYYPINPQKYVGDINNIIYRSSWEKKFCQYCDLNPNILKWSSEPIGIPYWNPIDKKEHKYYVDFYIQVKKHDNTIENWLIEIKPQEQYKLEKRPVYEGYYTEKKLHEYNEKLKTWIINRSKFHAAKKYAESMGYKFGTIDETFQLK